MFQFVQYLDGEVLKNHAEGEDSLVFHVHSSVDADNTMAHPGSASYLE